MFVWKFSKIRADHLLWLAWWVMIAGCESPTSPPLENRLASPSDVALDSLRPQVEAFCGGCHDTPPASSFPKRAWRQEVERGYEFYYESFREDLSPPPKKDVIAYFESLAPEDLRVQPPTTVNGGGVGLQWERSSTALPEFAPPAVSFLTWAAFGADPNPRLLFTDMRSGELRVVTFQEQDHRSDVLANCAYPCHVAPCDLDNDGRQELIIAELGSPESGDHFRGAVIWLRPTADGWKQRLLFSGVGRVADVRPADFDNDGDTDLVVAEFGHFHTGAIWLLENIQLEAGVPRFREHKLDDRHGTIHVPVADLNGDGWFDFVALVSQDYEVVDAFMNEGDGTFRRERIFSGNDPAYGSSGIQIVDLDQDGDPDVLFSNGDTFGSEYLKPYHGIHWLENRGVFPWEDHLLASMVGVQKALAGDLDGDGYLDIAAVALMPKNLAALPQLESHNSVIWLQQIERGVFARQPLETGRFYHAALELADTDCDGDQDLVIGNMVPDHLPSQPWLTLWSNRGPGDE